MSTDPIITVADLDLMPDDGGIQDQLTSVLFPGFEYSVANLFNL